MFRSYQQLLQYLPKFHSTNAYPEMKYGKICACFKKTRVTLVLVAWIFPSDYDKMNDRIVSDNYLIIFIRVRIKTGLL